MEFTTLQADLSRELAQARGSVESKVTIPILGHVLLETMDTGVVRITATDLEVSYTGLAPASIAQPGAVALPAKQLTDWCAKFKPEDQVRFLVSEETLWATLSCGKSRARIAGNHPDQFPDRVEFAPSVASVPAQALHNVLEYTAFAQGDDPVKVAMNGVQLKISENRIQGAATTGKSLSYKTYDVELPFVTEHEPFVIRKPAVAELLRLLARTTGDVEIMPTANHVRFAWEGSEFLAVLSEGRFPDYTRALSLGDDRPFVLVPGETLKRAVERVMQFADNTMKITFSISPGVLEISARADLGEGTETLDVDYDGPPVVFGQSYKFLKGFLQLAKEDPVKIMFMDEKTTVEWGIPDRPDWRFLLSPMQ